MAFSLAAFRSLWPLKGADGGPPNRRVDADGGAESEARASTPPTAGTAKRGRTYGREAAALMLMATGLFLALALASFEGDPLRAEAHGSDWVGPVGSGLAHALVASIGVVAWLVPLELLLVSQPLFADRRFEIRTTRVSGDVLIAVMLAAMLHIASPHATAFGEMPLGGYVGELFGSVMRGLFSTVGSFLIGLTVVGLILVERATFSFIEAMLRLRTWLVAARERANRGAGEVAAAWARAREEERERQAQQRRDAEPLIVAPERADDIIAAFAEDHADAGPFSRAAVRSRSALPASVAVRAASDPRSPAVAPPIGSDGDPDPRDAETPAPDLAVEDLGTPSPDAPSPSRPSIGEPIVSVAPAAVEEADDPIDEVPSDEAPTVKPGAVGAAAPEAAPAAVRARKAKKAPEEPVIVDTSQVTKVEKAKRSRAASKAGSAFQLPSAELLDPVIIDTNGPSKEQLHETAHLLEKTLADYKVEGKVQEIWPGPTVTMYEVAPAPGTKVSRVASLADDLALALARKVRIIAPIPGKNRIGFEVPNERRTAVSLRDLIESKAFMSMDAPLPCVLGRDIIGNPCFADLSSMPHVIVAGATGAGKSVGLNVMLLSMLYRRTPEELRLLMIDPKVVELAPFDRIPHLLFPVVTDMKQAANALKWTVDEMERRYQLFADAGTRNIGSYNKWVAAVRAGERPMPASPKVVEAVAPDGTGVEVAAAKDGSDAEPPKALPFIVVVVDEFADLMMTHGKDVEASVARLAQKARAAGIHVILATQRPSVDVITGMIKANFPSRVAFRVVQRNDSGTILDQQGAEHLLGKGDMLVKLNGTTDVKRVQCPFASEEEVQRVTDYLRSQGEPEYDESIVRSRDDEENGDPLDSADAENDPLYDAAVRVVAETRRATTSFLQRKLGVGYNRAAKIIETMEKRGVIGPAVGTRPREVLISPM